MGRVFSVSVGVAVVGVVCIMLEIFLVGNVGPSNDQKVLVVIAFVVDENILLMLVQLFTQSNAIKNDSPGSFVVLIIVLLFLQFRTVARLESWIFHSAESLDILMTPRGYSISNLLMIRPNAGSR